IVTLRRTAVGTGLPAPVQAETPALEPAGSSSNSGVLQDQPEHVPELHQDQEERRVAWPRSAAVRVASLRLAPARVALKSIAPVRLAPKRSAPVRVAECRLAPERLALSSLALVRSAWLRSRRVSGFFARHPRIALAPCRTTSTCSGFAMTVPRSGAVHFGVE